MPNTLILLPVATTLLLLVAGVALRGRTSTVRWAITALAGLHAAAALLALGHRVLAGVAFDRTLPAFVQPIGPVPLAQDGIALLMLALVSFVGWAVARYSLRCLDGDRDQAAFFRSVALTVGAVSASALAGDLAWMIGALALSSLGIHRLLTHAGTPGARRTAWTKFFVSRLGDVALGAALILLWSAFGTLELETLLAAGATVPDGESVQPALVLLALGALLKSAQFPLHTWLPQTLDTPTPVSALMHAGVVNAGGFLMVRLSPMIAESTPALLALATVGAVTAVFGVLTMLTQPTVKRALAHSTVAQMGFMMMQCGMGAFAAAMLHIVAHSLYKAYAFLASGDVMEEARASAATAPAAGDDERRASRVAAFCALALLAVAASAAVGGRTGSAALLAIFASGIALGVHDAGRVLGALGSAPRTLLVAAVLFGSYVGCYALVASIVGAGVPSAASPAGAIAVALLLFAALALFHVLQRASERARRTSVRAHRARAEPAPHWTDALYVHASNGFYLDVWIRRLTLRI